MKIAMVAARFSPAEANQLRKAMATFRSGKQLSAHKGTMVGRMVERGTIQSSRRAASVR